MDELRECLQNLHPPPEVATVVTAIHFGANNITGRYFASSERIETARNILVHSLSSIPFPVRLQSSDDADVDFCTLVRLDSVLTLTKIQLLAYLD